MTNYLFTKMALLLLIYVFSIRDIKIISEETGHSYSLKYIPVVNTILFVACAIRILFRWISNLFK